MKARVLCLSTVLLAAVRGVHPPPDQCCDGPARPVNWISLSNTSALAAACHLSAVIPPSCGYGHSRPSVSCKTSIVHKTRIESTMARGTQLHYSKENSLGCAALTACTHDGEELWMTCPDGFEADCVLGCTALPKASSCPDPQQSLVEWLSSTSGPIQYIHVHSVSSDR